MPDYKVHVLSTVRHLVRPTIQADTPKQAAEYALGKVDWDQAALGRDDDVEHSEWNEENTCALVDVVGDDQYQNSTWVRLDDASGLAMQAALDAIAAMERHLPITTVINYSPDLKAKMDEAKRLLRRELFVPNDDQVAVTTTRKILDATQDIGIAPVRGSMRFDDAPTSLYMPAGPGRDKLVSEEAAFASSGQCDAAHAERIRAAHVSMGYVDKLV